MAQNPRIADWHGRRVWLVGASAGIGAAMARELAGNGSGPLSIDSPLSIELYRVSMLAPSKSSGISFNGILGERQSEILDLLVRQQKAVLIDPVERQTEMRD